MRSRPKATRCSCGAQHGCVSRAQWIVDVGPGAGSNGGGALQRRSRRPVRNRSIRDPVSWIRGRRRGASSVTPGGWVRLRGVELHNLAGGCGVPAGSLLFGHRCVRLRKVRLVCGPWPSCGRPSSRSGSLSGNGTRGDRRGDRHSSSAGCDADQKPGRTPRSNVATYTGLFDAVRKAFSELPLSRERGYSAGRSPSCRRRTLRNLPRRRLSGNRVALPARTYGHAPNATEPGTTSRP